MPHANVILFLGTHEQLQRDTRHLTKSRGYQLIPLANLAALNRQKELVHVTFVVVAHEPGSSEGLSLLRALRTVLPTVPAVVFTSECASLDVFKACTLAGIRFIECLPAAREQVLAVLEQFCPGYAQAPAAFSVRSGGMRVGVGAAATLLAISGATQSGGAQLPPPPPGEMPNTEMHQELPQRMTFRFLGDFLVEFAGKSLVMPQKTNSLLAYLVLNHKRAFGPDALAKLFWAFNFRNEFSRTQARNSLKSEVSNIRRYLRELTGLPNEQFIEFNRKRKEYQWVPGMEWEADVLNFTETKTEIDGLKRGGQPVPTELYRAALQAYTGHFMRDFRQETDENGEWIRDERDHLSCDFEELADAYSDLLWQEARYGQVLSLCNEILKHDERRLKSWYLKLEALHKEQQYLALEQAIRQFRQVIHFHFHDSDYQTELRNLDQFLQGLSRSAA